MCWSLTLNITSWKLKFDLTIWYTYLAFQNWNTNDKTDKKLNLKMTRVFSIWTWWSYFQSFLAYWLLPRNLAKPENNQLLEADPNLKVLKNEKIFCKPTQTLSCKTASGSWSKVTRTFRYISTEPHNPCVSKISPYFD